jgi:hypothetical protein
MGRPKIDRPANLSPNGERNRQQWDRQDHEGSEAYRAFCAYRDSHPNERTYEKISQTLSCSIQLVKRWGSHHRWVSRAMAWDDYIDSLQQERSIEARLAMHRQHARTGAKLVQKGAVGIERLRASKLSPRDRVAMIRAGVEIERSARGETSKGTDSGAPVNSTQVVIHWGSNKPAWANVERVLPPVAGKVLETDPAQSGTRIVANSRTPRKGRQNHEQV